MNKQDFLLLATLGLALKHSDIPLDETIENAKTLTESVFKLTKVEPYQYDKESLKKVVEYCTANGSVRYGTRIENVFADNNLQTVDDLLEFGITRLKKQKNMGRGSLIWIEHALYDLYGITF